MPTPAEYTSFLIRLWREAGASAPATDWHGEVEHIQTNQRWTFDSLDEVLNFLRRQAEGPEGGRRQADE